MLVAVLLRLLAATAEDTRHGPSTEDVATGSLLPADQVRIGDLVFQLTLRKWSLSCEVSGASTPGGVGDKVEIPAGVLDELGTTLLHLPTAHPAQVHTPRGIKQRVKDLGQQW